MLKNNEQFELAQRFLRKSLDICFQDSETHFLLAEIYIKEGYTEDAKKHLQYACEGGGYAPAEKLLKQISQN